MKILSNINKMCFMNIMKILNIMNIMNIMNIFNIMNIHAWMAMAGAVSALVESTALEQCVVFPTIHRIEYCFCRFLECESNQSTLNYLNIYPQHQPLSPFALSTIPFLQPFPWLHGKKGMRPSNSQINKNLKHGFSVQVTSSSPSRSLFSKSKYICKKKYLFLKKKI